MLKPERFDPLWAYKATSSRSNLWKATRNQLLHLFSVFLSFSLSTFFPTSFIPSHPPLFSSDSWIFILTIYRMQLSALSIFWSFLALVLPLIALKRRRSTFLLLTIFHFFSFTFVWKSFYCIFLLHSKLFFAIKLIIREPKGWRVSHKFSSTLFLRHLIFASQKMCRKDDEAHSPPSRKMKNYSFTVHHHLETEKTRRKWMSRGNRAGKRKGKNRDRHQQ